MKKLLVCLFIFQLTGCATFFKWANDPDKVQSQSLNQRTFSTMLEDKSTEGTLLRMISTSAPEILEHHIDIHAYNGILLITGNVPLQQHKNKVDQLAESLPHVSQIHNKLIVGQLDPVQQQYPTDQWITARLKARMLFTEGFPSSKLKVTTFNRVVYLIGTLPQEQADIAVSMAKQVRGIRKIVKIIQVADNHDARPIKDVATKQ